MKQAAKFNIKNIFSLSHVSYRGNGQCKHNFSVQRFTEPSHDVALLSRLETHFHFSSFHFIFSSWPHPCMPLHCNRHNAFLWCRLISWWADQISGGGSVGCPRPHRENRWVRFTAQNLPHVMYLFLIDNLFTFTLWWSLKNSKQE